MFYVCIDHLQDNELSFLGYTLVAEDDQFKMYRHYTGDEHIVDKQGKKFLMVEDMNDAEIMRSREIIQIPDR